MGFLPAAHYLRLAFANRLGADPVQALEHELGLIALQLLIAALCVTPLRELTRLNLLRFRRMLGLMAFYYVVMHFSVWLVLDRQLDWPRILAGSRQASLHRARFHGAADADPAGG